MYQIMHPTDGTACAADPCDFSSGTDQQTCCNLVSCDGNAPDVSGEASIESVDCSSKTDHNAACTVTDATGYTGGTVTCDTTSGTGKYVPLQVTPPLVYRLARTRPRQRTIYVRTVATTLADSRPQPHTPPRTPHAQGVYAIVPGCPAITDAASGTTAGAQSCDGGTAGSATCSFACVSAAYAITGTNPITCPSSGAWPAHPTCVPVCDGVNPNVDRYDVHLPL